MTKIALPEALPNVQAAIDKGVLRAGAWGDGNDAVCMMSAAVSGAQSVQDCVTAGWPKWLAALNVSLFDAAVGADDEDKARAQFALDVALLIQTPRDMNRAHDLFVVASLKRIVTYNADVKGVIQTVIDLYEHRLSGGEVSKAEWNAAADAAVRATDYATDYAATYNADYDAAYAAAHEAAAEAACAAADAAAYNAACAAARAASRADLLAALGNS